MTSNFRSVTELDFDADTQFAVQGHWLESDRPYRLRIKRRIGCVTRWQEIDVKVLAVAPMRGARRSGERQYMIELDRDIYWPDCSSSNSCRLTDDGFWIDPVHMVPELGSVVAYFLLPLETGEDGRLYQMERVPSE